MPIVELILLHAATAIAAFFQSVTGIGFGMVAGPVVLVVLDDPQAVVISTLMSWLISLVLFPFLWRGADTAMLRRLTLGAAMGLPAGLGLLAISDADALKLIAGVVIGLLTALMLFGAPGTRQPGRAGDMIFGGLGGVFGGCLAMPGPTAALRLGGLGIPKATVRATMVCFFVAIWPLIFAGQWATIGISSATAWNALSLVPATLAGLAAGNWAASRVSERLFRGMVFFFLIATSLSLLTNALFFSGT